MKDGAGQTGNASEQRATEGQTPNQQTGRIGQSENGAGPTEQSKPAGQQIQPGQRASQRPNAQQLGAQGRAGARQGAATPAQTGAQATRQQPLQGQARAQGAAISPDQQARIRDTVRNDHAARIDHADFGLNVGAVVPRSERLAVLPSNVVAIVPRYRGYKFVIVEDDIVIVDPRTYRVAAVIPETGEPGVAPGIVAPRAGGPCG
ncbi:DUF1236 domain-containing protein [Methylocystis bryophila]|uniref:DUF1236 domain-containing protein n=1 Tax=Methylocystis bryophila TaxID=655015 RepID=UPI00131A1E68|nr:DUF1236 domain-containing protein [Methylocystis bryophila]